MCERLFFRFGEVSFRLRLSLRPNSWHLYRIPLFFRGGLLLLLALHGVRVTSSGHSFFLLSLSRDMRIDSHRQSVPFCFTMALFPSWQFPHLVQYVLCMLLPCLGHEPAWAAGFEPEGGPKTSSARKIMAAASSLPLEFIEQIQRQLAS